MSPRMLIELPKGGGVVRLSLTTFKGKPYVDLRQYIEDEAGELVPTRKGVMLSPEQARDVLAGLTEAVALLVQGGELAEVQA